MVSRYFTPVRYRVNTRLILNNFLTFLISYHSRTWTGSYTCLWVLLWYILASIKSGLKSRIFAHDENVKLEDCLENILLTLYQKTIQMTSSGRIRMAKVAYFFNPNKEIISIRNTIIATIILTKEKKTSAIHLVNNSIYNQLEISMKW